MAVEEEKLEEIKVLAERRYGRKWKDLSPEEQDNMYRDYEGERDVANAQYAEGQAGLDTELGEGIMAGNVYVGRGLGNAASVLANKWVGKRNRDKADARLEELSKQRQSGAKAAGEIAQSESRRIEAKSDRQSDRLMSLLEARNEPKAAAQSGAGGVVPPPNPAAAQRKRIASQPRTAPTGPGQGPLTSQQNAPPGIAAPQGPPAGADLSPQGLLDTAMQPTAVSAFPEQLSPEARMSRNLGAFDEKSGFDQFKELAGEVPGMTPAAGIAKGADSAVKSATGMSITDLAKMGFTGTKLDELLKKLGIGR